MEDSDRYALLISGERKDRADLGCSMIVFVLIDSREGSSALLYSLKLPPGEGHL